MITQPGPPSEEQPPTVAQMIAAVCAALRDAGDPREEAQPPAGAVADQLELDARLQGIRARLDWIDAQVGKLEAELALLRRITGRSTSATADKERSSPAGMTG